MPFGDITLLMHVDLGQEYIVGSKWILNKLHRLGYTESYSETKYCLINGRSRDDTPDTYDTLDTNVEEMHDQIND